MADHDLTIKVYGQSPAGFVCGIGVEAACTESGKTLALDQVGIVPLDEGSVIYSALTPLAAGEGILLNAASPIDPVNVNVCDSSGGMAESVIGDGVEIRGNPRMRPNKTNRLTLIAYTPSNATPGAAYVRVDHAPVFRSPLET